MTPNDVWFKARAALRRWLDRALEPKILFPAIAVLILAVIWTAVFNVINLERANAERGAAVSARELAETYEAQIVRALREIDQTLKFAKYAYEFRGEQAVLREMKARSLLPADLLFVVSIANSQGDVIATTRTPPLIHVAGQDYFESQRERNGQTDLMSVGQPRQAPGSGEWTLQFSRRLNGADGAFAGIVMISVGADYFVSGYEAAKLGEHGVLGLLGTDGISRVRRSGDSVIAGDRVDFAAAVPAREDVSGEAVLAVNGWDGVRRYTSARQLYEFPLAVLVGLSVDEQLAPTHRRVGVYLWEAGGGSILMILIVAILGSLSAKLAASRVRAVAQQIVHAEQVEYLAYHDGLTSLPNRSLFSKLLGQSISQAHRYKRQLAVLFLDLDRFKHINDTLGHEAGDQLLQEVATRLGACLRDSDTVARLGGDEFVVLLPEVTEDRYAARVAQKILAEISRPFVLLGQECRITASIGISTYPQDGLDEQTLTKNADVAMYQAKEEGKNNFQFYSESLNANSLERLGLESGLRHAAERGEFKLYYQVRREINTGRITGMEALLRWQNPRLGVVAPVTFIPVAEETGMIVPIGKWVLRTACLQNVAWQKQGLAPMSVAVNLTARQFLDENLLVDLATIIAETGMDVKLLELEIAESLLMRDVARSLRILAGLKNMGVRIAIDDFGNGYSSLSTLQHFPLDTIKIDRSIIRDAHSDAEDKDLTEAIIAMGRTLSMTIVAQGVETREQADFMRQNAGDGLQGFNFNKPVPADQVPTLLATQSGEEP